MGFFEIEEVSGNLSCSLSPLPLTPIKQPAGKGSNTPTATQTPLASVPRYVISLPTMPPMLHHQCPFFCLFNL
jgi:hypothetical protein